MDLFRHEGQFTNEYLETTLLRAQYEHQIDIFNKSGLIQQLSSQTESGIMGIDPKNHERISEYSVPSFEAIQSALREKSIKLETKVQQGFNKLLLVPIAKPLDALRQIYSESLRNHYTDGKLFNSAGEVQDLDAIMPVWAWKEYNNADITNKLVYYPKCFDANNHGGMIKAELVMNTLSTSFPGWEVRLIEELPNLPAEGLGQTIGGRKQIEANHTPNEYLQQSQNDNMYENEDGYIPEAWLTEALVHLETTNQVFDDYEGKGKVTFLTGSFFPDSGYVPYAFFERKYKQAVLRRNIPDYSDSSCSTRRSVQM